MSQLALKARDLMVNQRAVDYIQDLAEIRAAKKHPSLRLLSRCLIDSLWHLPASELCCSSQLQSLYSSSIHNASFARQFKHTFNTALIADGLHVISTLFETRTPPRTMHATAQARRWEMRVGTWIVIHTAHFFGFPSCTGVACSVLVLAALFFSLEREESVVVGVLRVPDLPGARGC